MPMQTDGGPAPAAQSGDAFEDATFRRVVWRLVPLLFLGYFMAYLDRVNVGFAKLQMASDLHLSDEVYGFGAGIFFLGYVFFEVPSNLVLQRVGARKWIARIMITWGLISASFMFADQMHWGPVSAAFGTTDAEFSFYVLRLLLGIAEAGFYPGVILYLTFWFPAHRRAHVVALFITAVPLTGVIGNPLNGAIMQFLDGAHGMRGWEWLFLVEGIPSVVLGLVVLAMLPDGPQSAKWLSSQERSLIERRIAEEEGSKAGGSHRSQFREILFDVRIWVLAFAYMCASAGSYATTFWGPTIIQEAGIAADDFLQIGLLMMAPYCFSAVCIVLWARHSDRTGERRWHASLAMLFEVAGLLVLAFAGHSTIASLIGVGLVSFGVLAWLSVFWSIPTSFLSGAAAAGGIAMINGLSNFGGYFGPDLVGAIRDANGGDNMPAFLTLAGLALICSILTFVVAGRMKHAGGAT